MDKTSEVPAVTVSDAVATRRSVRGFTSQSVPQEVIRDILTKASRAPSGGNLQPWRVFVMTGEPLKALISEVSEKAAEKGLAGDGDFEYNVYPPELGEPYRTHRFQSGETLYAALGIERGDKAGRAKQFMNNFRFFGAPAGLFFCIDRQMGEAQWADMGLFMQTVMLLAVEQGLATCPQEAWSLWHKTVRNHLDIPGEYIVFCGMALGFPDEENPVNNARTERVAVDDFATFLGFQ